MNTKKRFIISFCMVFLAAAVSVSGQSLFNSEYYRKALDLQKQAETAFENGEYDLSLQYSRESEAFTSLSELYGTLVYHRYKANGSIALARNRITYARGIHADENFPSEYSSALASFAEASRLFSEGEMSYRLVTGYLQNPDVNMEKTPFEAGIAAYTQSGTAGKQVLGLLENIRVVVKEPVKVPEPAPVVVETPKVQEKKEIIVLSVPAPVEEVREVLLPKYYTVRLIPNRRDCFWRIAEYSFVFGNPLKWPQLYELNKNKLPDPKNPNLMLPGMVIEIPSLNGEKREGMWDPKVTYPPLKTPAKKK